MRKGIFMILCSLILLACGPITKSKKAVKPASSQVAYSCDNDIKILARYEKNTATLKIDGTVFILSDYKSLGIDEASILSHYKKGAKTLKLDGQIFKLSGWKQGKYSAEQGLNDSGLLWDIRKPKAELREMIMDHTATKSPLITTCQKIN